MEFFKRKKRDQLLCVRICITDGRKINLNYSCCIDIHAIEKYREKRIHFPIVMIVLQ